jgi:hypothetical protein
VLGAAEGPLGVDDPGLASERAEVDTAVVELSTRVGALKRSEHLAAKESAHGAHGKKEVLAGAHPARRIVREPATVTMACTCG